MRSLRAAVYSLSSLFSLPDAPGPGTRSRDHLTIVQTQDFPSLDPIFVSGVGGQELAALLYSYLVKFDDRGELVPDAALEVPTRANGGISPDGRTIVYHLRPGVRFSDGSEPDVVRRRRDDRPRGLPRFRRAIARRLRRHRRDFDTGRNDGQGLPSHPVRADRPVSVRPGNAVPILSGRQLAGHAHLRGTILDSDADRKRTLSRSIVGLRGERVELRANPYYFGGTPKIERITILPVPSVDDRVRNAAKRAKSTPTSTPTIRSTRELAALPGQANRIGADRRDRRLIFNTTQPALADARVRRALTQGLGCSRRRRTRRCLGGDRARNPGRGLFEWAYDPHAYAMPSHDAGAAARALDAAGWRMGPDGVRHKGGASLALDVIVRADKPSALEMATLMQAQSARSGSSLDSPFRRQRACGAGRAALRRTLRHRALSVHRRVRSGRARPVRRAGASAARLQQSALLQSGARSNYEEAVRPYEPCRSEFRITAKCSASWLAICRWSRCTKPSRSTRSPSWLRNEHSAVNTPFWNVADWSF